MAREPSTKPFLIAFRVPQELNLRIDQAVLDKRKKTGGRITKAAFLTAILEQVVPLTPEVTTKTP